MTVKKIHVDDRSCDSCSFLQYVHCTAVIKMFFSKFSILNLRVPVALFILMSAASLSSIEENSVYFAFLLLGKEMVKHFIIFNTQAYIKKL